ncbi:MAG TPA: DM13 domain-containing protein [Blastocatellia bacterium]|nr:DM13 domain-containing protein [Blastocatellia bacterium]
MANETVERSGFVPPGELRQSEGEMIYPVPAGLDLNRYRAVTIWSRRYRVSFTTAPLREP